MDKFCMCSCLIFSALTFCCYLITGTLIGNKAFEIMMLITTILASAAILSILPVGIKAILKTQGE